MSHREDRHRGHQSADETPERRDGHGQDEDDDLVDE